MKIADMGVEQCHCGALKPVDRECRQCPPEGKPTTDIRCPGWSCPMTDSCSRYTHSLVARNNTRWMEPPYDPLARTCEDFAPVVLGLLNNPME